MLCLRQRKREKSVFCVLCIERLWERERGSSIIKGPSIYIGEHILVCEGLGNFMMGLGCGQA